MLDLVLKCMETRNLQILATLLIFYVRVMKKSMFSTSNERRMIVHESVLEMIADRLNRIMATSSVGIFVADILGLFLLKEIVRFLSKSFNEIRHTSFQKLIQFLGKYLVIIARKLPFTSGLISKEFSKIKTNLESELKGPLGDPSTREKFSSLPKQGLPSTAIITKMKEFVMKEEGTWKEGYVSGAIYHGGDELLDLQAQGYKLYAVTNPLHTDLFPSVMKYEAEIISMTANLLNGGNERVCGGMTSGGTESIFMAAKTHREWFYQEYGITQPEIVAPQTAHAAIDKACEVLGIKLIHAPVNPKTRQVDVQAVRSRLSKDTIMIYSSAPQFPHGIIDPIHELSDLALEFGIGLHVDCCLGGFLLPFGRKLQSKGIADYGIPSFDFENPGVTSISVDTHKYGYSPKGSSVVLYRGPEIRKYQYFTYPKWPGGLYATPSMPGSRAGSLIAATWASMLYFGEEGYLNASKQILDASAEIRDEISRIAGLFVIGHPTSMVVAFGSDKFNIYSLNDLLHKRGWVLNSLQSPSCLHICVTMRTVPVTKRFIDDVRECSSTLLADPKATAAPGGSAPIYGMSSVMPDGPVEDILRMYTDITLTV